MVKLDVILANGVAMLVNCFRGRLVPEPRTTHWTCQLLVNRSSRVSYALIARAFISRVSDELKRLRIRLSAMKALLHDPTSLNDGNPGLPAFDLNPHLQLIMRKACSHCLLK